MLKTIIWLYEERLRVWAKLAKVGYPVTASALRLRCSLLEQEEEINARLRALGEKVD